MLVIEFIFDVLYLANFYVWVAQMIALAIVKYGYLHFQPGKQSYVYIAFSTIYWNDYSCITAEKFVCSQNDNVDNLFVKELQTIPLILMLYIWKNSHYTSTFEQSCCLSTSSGQRRPGPQILHSIL